MATSIEDLIECPVCITYLVDPQVLQCHHTFCKACVDQLIDCNNTKCPLCQSSFSAAEVRKDFNRVNFMQLIGPKMEISGNCEACRKGNVSHVCEDCEQGICCDCHIAHQRFKGTKNHTVVSLDAKWDQVKPIYDIQLKHLKDLRKDLDDRLLEHSEYQRNLMEIEHKAVNECDGVRELYINMINNKCDRINEQIRSHINNKSNNALEVNRRLLQRRSSIDSRLEKLRKYLDNKDIYDKKKTLDSGLTNLEKDEIGNFPNLTIIDVIKSKILNINEAINLSFVEIENGISAQRQEQSAEASHADHSHSRQSNHSTCDEDTTTDQKTICLTRMSVFSLSANRFHVDQPRSPQLSAIQRASRSLAVRGGIFQAFNSKMTRGASNVNKYRK